MHACDAETLEKLCWILLRLFVVRWAAKWEIVYYGHCLKLTEVA
jgi:hypothetical protein